MKQVKFINEVCRNGTSKSIRIPSYIVKMLGLNLKDVVEITIKKVDCGNSKTID